MASVIRYRYCKHQKSYNKKQEALIMKLSRSSDNSGIKYRQLINEETTPHHRKHKKPWLGKMVAFVKVLPFPWLWKNLLRNTTPRLLFSRKLSQQDPAIAHAPVKVPLRFTRDAFRFATLYERYPCDGAERLAAMLHKYQMMETTGGMEHTLSQIFQLQAQNEVFNNHVMQASEQHFHYIAGKGDQTQLISPQEVEDKKAEKITIYGLREQRLSVVERIREATAEVLKVLSPQKELDKIAKLSDAYQKGEVSDADYRQQMKHLIKALTIKEQNYQKNSYNRNPNIKSTVKQWLKQIAHSKRNLLPFD
ncbi:MAG: hypothetical protein OXD32_03060 [Endozoicomonadaceae bacterium]|nr:hypothetical protein [Endozoicomonadaceae bacterium]